MATFFSNQQIWYWTQSSHWIKGTLTGTVSRSGNTVTLSSMSLSLSWWSSSAWGSDTLSFTVNGTKTSRSVSAGSTSFAVNSTSFSVGTTDTSKSVGWSSSDGYSGSFTVTFPSGATAPSTPSVSISSRTWNSVTGSVSISSFGTPSSEANRYIEFGVCNSSNTAYGNPYRFATKKAVTSSSFTINNSSSTGSTAFSLKGCKSFKIGGYANNTKLSSNKLDSTTYYLPPAPLQTLSVASQTVSDTADQVTVKLNITGGTSTDNENVTVTTEYRTNIAGAGWGSWTSAGTGTPWTTKNPTFTCRYGQSVQVQARQVYQSQYSAVKELSFTSTAATAPTGTVEIISKTPHTITIKGSVTSWGHPSNYTKESGSGNRNQGWIRVSDGVSGHGTLEVGMTGAPQTITITNASTRAHGGLVRLYPGETVTPDIYLSNGLTSKASTGAATTLPNIPTYVPNNGKSDKVKYGYVSVSGKSKSIKKMYVGKNGKSVLAY